MAGDMTQKETCLAYSAHIRNAVTRQTNEKGAHSWGWRGRGRHRRGWDSQSACERHTVASARDKPEETDFGNFRSDVGSVMKPGFWESAKEHRGNGKSRGQRCGRTRGLPSVWQPGDPRGMATDKTQIKHRWHAKTQGDGVSFHLLPSWRVRGLPWRPLLNG